MLLYGNRIDVYLGEVVILMSGIADDYIEITDTRQKQTLLIKLLEQFHELCEVNGLIYNIFGGTMLGAVRHHGIIPWDDDIDVTMPRKDYIQFIALVKNKYSNKFNIHVYPDEGYIYPYAKFGMKDTVLYENEVKRKYNKLSLYIDVFPNDGYPINESVFEKYKKYEDAIILLTYNLPRRRSYFKRTYIGTKKFVYKFWGVNYFVKKQIQMLSESNEENSTYIICQGAGWGKKGKLKKEIYYDRILYEFDGIKVWGIRDYHNHLTNLYGDYMVPPPEDKRRCPHNTRLFIESNVYDKYLNS